MMKEFIWLLGAAFCFTANAQVRCINHNKERLIHKDDLASGGCIVTSNKKVIYRARKDKTFCERKLHAHIKKLKQVGWYCVG